MPSEDNKGKRRSRKNTAETKESRMIPLTKQAEEFQKVIGHISSGDLNNPDLLKNSATIDETAIDKTNTGSPKKQVIPQKTPVKITREKLEEDSSDGEVDSEENDDDKGSNGSEKFSDLDEEKKNSLKNRFHALKRDGIPMVDQSGKPVPLPGTQIPPIDIPIPQKTYIIDHADFQKWVNGKDDSGDIAQRFADMWMIDDWAGLMKCPDELSIGHFISLIPDSCPQNMAIIKARRAFAHLNMIKSRSSLMSIKEKAKFFADRVTMFGDYDGNSVCVDSISRILTPLARSLHDVCQMHACNLEAIESVLTVTSDRINKGLKETEMNLSQVIKKLHAITSENAKESDMTQQLFRASTQDPSFLPTKPSISRASSVLSINSDYRTPSKTSVNIVEVSLGSIKGSSRPTSAKSK